VIALALLSAAVFATAPAANAPKVAASDLIRQGTASVTVSAGSSLPLQDYRNVASGGTTAQLSGNYHMTRRIDLSVDVAFARNDGADNGTSENVPGFGTFTADQSWAASWVGAHAAWRMLVRGLPYVRLGTGVYHLKYRLDALNPDPTSLQGGDAEQTRMGGNVGAGASFRLTSGTRLGLEAVYHRLFISDVTVGLATVALTMTLSGGR